MICGNCDKTDGLVYTSLPPKVRCKITNNFHEMDDKCEFEWEPIIHGHWIDDKVAFHRVCSECGAVVRQDITLIYLLECMEKIGKLNYCPNCGAKMDEDNE